MISLKLPAAIVFLASCALPLSVGAQQTPPPSPPPAAGAAGASPQSGAKQALALKLAQLQVKINSATMVDQLTGSAVQPLFEKWSPRLNNLPPARQKELGDQLNAELKKFTDATQKAINDQLAKSAEAALVPVFMNKLSEDEMKTIITYMESPVSAKFQALGPEAFDAWANSIVEATRPTVKGGADNFEAAANRILGAPAATPPATGAPTLNGATPQK